jgi:pyruvate formate lyase activating enzyme
VKGMIFNIQHFSLDDGAGIRTTVFMKGCPLHCIWCHNPESKALKTQTFYNTEKCTGCRQCAKVCPNDCHSFDKGIHIYQRDNCIKCGKCVPYCFSKALEMVGVEKTVEEVVEEVLQDKLFYDASGGGITLSGGEPMYQFPFVYELAKSAKDKGLHVCMETCGFAKEELFLKIAPFIDVFLFDYKVTDTNKHQIYTGVSNEIILQNLKKLDALGKQIVLRCPIIPGCNDEETHFIGIANTANSLKNVERIDIIPYHPLGIGKSLLLGEQVAFDNSSYPTKDTVLDWVEQVSKRTTVLVKEN